MEAGFLPQIHREDASVQTTRPVHHYRKKAAAATTNVHLHNSMLQDQQALHHITTRVKNSEAKQDLLFNLAGQFSQDMTRGLELQARLARYDQESFATRASQLDRHLHTLAQAQNTLSAQLDASTGQTAAAQTDLKTVSTILCSVLAQQVCHSEELSASVSARFDHEHQRVDASILAVRVELDKLEGAYARDKVSSEKAGLFVRERLDHIESQARSVEQRVCMLEAGLSELVKSLELVQRDAKRQNTLLRENSARELAELEERNSRQMEELEERTFREIRRMCKPIAYL